jgi:hypothetical protein
MGRITLDVTAASGGAIADPDAGKLAAGAAPASGGAGNAPGAPSAEAARASLPHELDRLYDLLDRVDGYDARSGAPPAQSQLAKPGAPADAAAKNLAALPPASDCQKSLTAVAAAGFTDVHLRPVPYFNQGNPAWCKQAYDKHPAVPGESRTIGQAGCAPTALAMVDCGLRDAHTNPKATARFAVDNRVSGTPTSAGTNTAELARRWALHTGLGLTVGASSNRSENVDTLKAGLEANGLAIVSVGADASTGRGHFSSTSHVLVINGSAMRNGQEWFAVADPGRANQSQPHGNLLTTDAQVVQIGGTRNGIGNVWISRTQLEAEMNRCFVFRSRGVS